jgi:hypothetical protein
LVSKFLTFTFALFLLVISPLAASALDLGNGFNLSTVTYFNFTQASGDLFDTESNKDITAAQARANQGLADGFHFTRVYIIFDKEVNSALSIRITTDQATTRPDGANEATPFGFGGYGGAGRGSLFIKFAYAEYRFAPVFALRFGLTPTAWSPFEDNRSTYRFLRPNFFDEQGLVTSSDLGVAALGTFFGKVIGYHLMFSNGEGFQNNSIDGRGYAGQGRLDLTPLQGLTFSAFGLRETVHNGVSGWNLSREIYSAAYIHHLFRVAIEYFRANDRPKDQGPVTVATTLNSATGSKGPGTSGVRLDQGNGYGGWAWTRIPGVEPLRVFGRFYSIEPNSTTDAGKTTEINGGISYDLSKELIVAVDDTILTQKLLRTSNGEIERFKDNIIGVRAQLTF